MERAIDRTSYRRNSKNEVNQVKKNEIKNFNYIKMFLNQIIVSLLIIVLILTCEYFNINAVDKWITENISKGYGVSEVISLIKNMFENRTESANGNLMSGEYIKSISGEISGEIISGDIVFQTAVEGINQMLIDAQYVKENYEFFMPVKGIVTSEFGCRVSDSKVVSSYHTGLDIAANTGTKIYAAHAGTISMAKSFSTYGKCIMIENDDLVTVYAHCSSINVIEGQKVNKGDFIGKVGMTGNATGPHLHLEIRYQDRFIDPLDIFGEM